MSNDTAEDLVPISWPDAQCCIMNQKRLPIRTIMEKLCHVPKNSGSPDKKDLIELIDNSVSLLVKTTLDKQNVQQYIHSRAVQSSPPW